MGKLIVLQFLAPILKSVNFTIKSTDNQSAEGGFGEGEKNGRPSNG